MPLTYWWEAFTTAVLLINSLPSSVLAGKTPSECLLNKSVDYSSFKVFGCACYPCLRPYQQHKFAYHTERCVYLGPSPSHKGHKCMNSSGRTYISRHVKFDETFFPFSQDFLTSGTSPSTPSLPTPLIQWLNHPEISQPTSHPISNSLPMSLPSSPDIAAISNTPPSPHNISHSGPDHQPNSFTSSPLSSSPPNIAQSAPFTPSSPPISPIPIDPHPTSPPLPPSTIPLHPNPQPTHPMITRGKAGIFRPKAWLTQTHTDWSQTEPTRIDVAMASPP